MSNKVLYFSRSGETKKVADKLAEKLGCGTIEITDDISWKGIFGFMKGGYYSLNKKITQVTLEDDFNVAEVDNIILAVPLWAGFTAPAGYSFLLKEYKNIRNLYMIICSDGSSSEKAYERIEALVGPVANKYGIINSSKNEDQIIEEVCSAIS